MIYDIKYIIVLVAKREMKSEIVQCYIIIFVFIYFAGRFGITHITFIINWICILKMYIPYMKIFFSLEFELYEKVILSIFITTKSKLSL